MADPTTPWTDRDIVALVVSTGVISAVANVGFGAVRDWLFARRKRTREANYLALRLAVTLEEYMHVCSEQLQDNDNASEIPEEPLPLINYTLPKLPEPPTDVDAWRALDSSLAARFLSLPGLVSQSQALINSLRSHDVDDAYYSVEEQLLRRALDAAKLAHDLRKSSRLPAAEPIFDVHRHLDRRLAEFLEQAKRREAGQIELISAIQVS